MNLIQVKFNLEKDKQLQVEKSDETVRKYKKGETEGKLGSKATTATAAVADGGLRAG